MAAELLRIHPVNPEQRKIRHVVDVLSRGGLIVYPTDTVYGIGCDLMNKKAIDRLCQALGLKPQKQLNLSFMCHDLSQVSEYARRIETPVFKMMKRAFPGPFTFILDAGGKVPKVIEGNKKTVGIRIPDHPVPLDIIAMLGNPLVNASLKNQDTVREYTTDPEEMLEDLRHLVDIVIDIGAGGNVPSTVIDCTSGEAVVTRQGLGDFATL